MVSRVIDDLVTTSVGLLNGDDLIVTSTGQIATLTGNGVGLQGTNEVLINGEILAANNTAVISIAPTASARITVGMQGSVVANQNFDAVNLAVSSEMRFVNFGLITGFDGVELAASDAGAILHFGNDGVVQGRDDGVDIRAGGGEAIVSNAGDIFASDDAIRIVADGASAREVFNEGLIVSGLTAIDASTGSASTNVFNVGEIHGSIEFGVGGDFYDGRFGFVNGPVLGSLGDDTLRGGDEDNVFLGGADRDFVTGGDGHDLLSGDSGLDTLNGNAGDDTILGGSSADTIRGQRGDDSIEGEGGSDKLFGGAGDDTIIGGGGSDTINGNAGDDSVDGGAGSDRIFGGPGNDTLTGGNQADTFVFKLGSDGNTVITDFENNTDRIDLRDLGVASVSEMRSLNVISEVDNAAILDLNAYGVDLTIRLIGMTDAQLGGSDFIL